MRNRRVIPHDRPQIILRYLPIFVTVNYRDTLQIDEGDLCAIEVAERQRLKCVKLTGLFTLRSDVNPWKLRIIDSLSRARK